MGMTTPFFITGLPRSGTAWLANLLTTGFTLCHHDLLGDVTDMADFCQRLGPRVGDSDSGLLFFYPQLLERFPQAHWVLVQRPVSEAVPSLHNLYKRAKWKPMETKAVELMVTHYDAMRAKMACNPKVLKVAYTDVFREAGARAIWGHCIDVLPFNLARFEILRKLRVERIPETMQLNPRMIPTP